MKRYDLVTNYRAGSSIEEMEPSDEGEWVRFEDIKPSDSDKEHAGLMLAKSLTDEMLYTLRMEWGNTNAAVLAHWRGLALGCDCAAMGNMDKPKQHWADPHAKNCKIYTGK